MIINLLLIKKKIYIYKFLHSISEFLHICLYLVGAVVDDDVADKHYWSN